MQSNLAAVSPAPEAVRDAVAAALGDKAKRIDLKLGEVTVLVTPANYLADIDSGFYVTSYLRSWAFEAQFRTHLRERFGNDWFTKREAGSLVRELWETGMSMTADEVLAEVAGQELEMDAVAQLTRDVLA